MQIYTFYAKKVVETYLPDTKNMWLQNENPIKVTDNKNMWLYFETG